MRLGLRQKLIVLVLVILVPLLLLLVFNLFRFFNLLEDDQVDLHVRDARAIGASLDRFSLELAHVARTAGLALAETRMTGPAADDYLRSVATSLPISSVAFIGADGHVQASSPPRSTGADILGDPAYRRVVAGADYAVSDLRRNPSGNVGFAVYSRVAVNGRFAGVAQVSVDAEDLGEVIPASLSAGTILITDSTGALVYGSRPEQAALTERQRRAWQSPGVRVALAGGEYTTRGTPLPQLQGRWLGAEVPVQGIGWTVGLFDPAGAALAGLSTEVALTIVGVAFVVGLSLYASRVYGLSITNPIERLTAATEEIRQGNFDAEVPVTTHDEIGELAQNFRVMQASLKHTLSDVQVIADAARRISGTLDLEAVAEAAADYLERIVEARAVAITLTDGFEPGRRLLAPRISPEAAEELVAQGSAIAAQTDLLSRGWVVARLAPSPALGLAAPGAGTLVVLPLVVNRRLIGRIDVAAAPTAPPGEFERADLPLAASLAQEVGVAAQNASLFEQQRSIADTLQDSLLTEPYRIPELDIGLVYEQATMGGRIGGDFYDFIPVEPGRTVVVVGDITGKGLQAARFTTIGKGAIRSFALDDPDPAAVLSRASRVIAEQIGVENFVTAVYMLFDLSDGCLTYAVAGHPPPLLYHSATGTVDPLPGGGTPLGIEGVKPYSDHRACMEVGDRLLLYTDGLSEARRGTELFGIERVGQVFAGFGTLPVRDVAAGIAEAAIAFAGGELQDDLALIVLERCPSRSSAAEGTTG
jgi:serine phosphatase RsbU (regulator of sigma subunit)/HAMP domain-containing protein